MNNERAYLKDRIEAVMHWNDNDLYKKEILRKDSDPRWETIKFPLRFALGAVKLRQDIEYMGQWWLVFDNSPTILALYGPRVAGPRSEFAPEARIHAINTYQLSADMNHSIQLVIEDLIDMIDPEVESGGEFEIEELREIQRDARRREEVSVQLWLGAPPHLAQALISGEQIDSQEPEAHTIPLQTGGDRGNKPPEPCL